MNSSIRAAGRLHGIANRRSMCGCTCEPRPSWNRPPEMSWMSLASIATVIGLRANATAIVDCSVIRVGRAGGEGERREHVVPGLGDAEAVVAVGLGRDRGRLDVERVTR